jgi:hypothetical protein
MRTSNAAAGAGNSSSSSSSNNNNNNGPSSNSPMGSPTQQGAYGNLTFSSPFIPEQNSLLIHPLVATPASTPAVAVAGAGAKDANDNPFDLHRPPAAESSLDAEIAAARQPQSPSPSYGFGLSIENQSEIESLAHKLNVSLSSLFAESRALLENWIMCSALANHALAKETLES